MIATAVAPIVVSSASSPKAEKATATAHPSTAVMVMSAIAELKEKKGSSLSAVKKYMSDNYRVDSARLAPFIRKFLKAAVLKGSLVQTNGVGATGRFKLPAEVKKKKKEPKVVVKKTSKSAAKKPAAAGTPKKRKLAAKKSPAVKKPKTTTMVVAKPRKSLGKVQKKPVSTIKQPKTTIAAKPKKSLVKVKMAVSTIKPPLTKSKQVTGNC